MSYKDGEGLVRKPYKDWLRCLGFFSLEESAGRPHCTLQLPLRASGGAAPTSVLCDHGQDSRVLLELCQRRFRLDIRKRFFSQRLGGH